MQNFRGGFIVISIEGLSKYYTSKKNQIAAVDDLTLNIKEGEIFGVIGYSGAGKSTFLRLLNRLEEPSKGRIVIDQQEITALNSKRLRLARQEIGMVFQHFNLLWSRTVKDNIAFPLEIAGFSKAERDERVHELIELVGLSDREHAYPSQLSGGQKQRVGIARALANNPNVLLCDEATSALDPETTNAILDLLVNINEKLGLTIILITHEMHVIRKICNRVAVMENGKVVEQGDVLDVFLHPKQRVTKRFVEQVMGVDDEDDGVSHLIHTYDHGKILRLHFIGETTNQALISQVAKKFAIDINILQGKITQTQRGAYGTLFVQIEGENEEVNKAVTFISDETSVEVEVIRDAN
nr:methionine ABC transporter ATP-binding protein [Virgibacillus halotolerans]